MNWIKVGGFDNDAWSWILNYRWPGNVRELKNAVERAVIMSTGPTITVADIAPRHLRPGSENDSYTGPSSPPRRRASDRTSALSGDNGSATVLGMTRDELFEAFTKFVSARVEAKATGSAVADGTSQNGDEGESDDEPEGLIVADRAQPAKAHAKAKTAKKRR